MPAKTVKINAELSSELIGIARQNQRKRSHYNLHQSYDDPVQRLCIAMLADTYIRPHLHPQPYKWELLIAIEGQCGVVIFDRMGCIAEQLRLAGSGKTTAVQIAPQTLHTIYPVDGSAIVMEVKPGPYTPIQPADFAAWAPEEGGEQVCLFQKWLYEANLGDCYRQMT
jgi:cupin fold WbuC family metalloprotein